MSAGIEFILPIAKWRGLGGKAEMRGRSFETFTHSAAAGAITKHIRRLRDRACADYDPPPSPRKP